MKTIWNTLDWSKSDKELSIDTGYSIWYIGNRRKHFNKPKAEKTLTNKRKQPFPDFWKDVNWDLPNKEISEQKKIDILTVSYARAANKVGPSPQHKELRWLYKFLLKNFISKEERLNYLKQHTLSERDKKIIYQHI